MFCRSIRKFLTEVKLLAAKVLCIEVVVYDNRVRFRHNVRFVCITILLSQ